MKSNINTGVCQWRATNGKPSFFVNWQEDGQQHYKFFAMRFQCEAFKNQLQNQ